ncbi:hypothetical protein HAX54_002607, partial [Datura stramonium]|nr:hypothetical protein [Datura stramonium]
MRAHDKVEVFDVYKATKLPAVYEELSVINVLEQPNVAQGFESRELMGKPPDKGNLDRGEDVFERK